MSKFTRSPQIKPHSDLEADFSLTSYHHDRNRVCLRIALRAVLGFEVHRMSSCTFLFLISDIAGSSGGDGSEYPWPLSSQRVPEPTKLPSIHELENHLRTSFELTNPSLPPLTRDSLVTITEESRNRRQCLPHPFEHPRPLTTAISKHVSNSYHLPNHASNSSLPPSTSPPHNFQSDEHYRALSNHDISRLIENFETVIIRINSSINL